MSSKVEKDQEPIPYQALLDENDALQDENRALKDEVQILRARLEEAEELKRAISEGDLDALVIPRPEGELIFTLDNADQAYRVLVETMNEGTATLAFDGTILYCNRRFAELLRMPIQAIIGKSIYRFIAPKDSTTFKALLDNKMGTGEANLRAEGGKSLPVYLSISSLQAEGSPNAWCLVVTDLTEQKKNEEIVAAERLARSIIEQSTETIIVCDTSGRIIRFSKAMLKLCGCDPAFQRFEDFMNLRSPEGADAGESIFPVSSALKGSTILGMEAAFEPDSQKFHFILNSGPLKNDDGEIIGCVVTITDITERKQEEQRICRYNHILDGINRIFNSVVQAKTEEELANECLSVVLEMTGSRIGFINLVGDDGLLHDIAISELGWKQCLMYDQTGHRRPPGNFVVHGLYGRVFDSREGFFTNKPLSHPDSIGLPYGHPPITSFLGVPLILDGKTMGMVGVTNREGGYSRDQLNDLEAIAPAMMQALHRRRSEEALLEAFNNLQVQSEELQAQSEELQIANEALCESEERFRTMANAIPQLAWIAKADGYIYWYNERWYSYTGTTPEQMEGWGWQSVHDPEVLPKVLEQWKASIASGQEFDMEFPLRGADGLYHQFLTRGFPLKDAKGQVLQWFGTNTDITERKHIEEKLKQSVKQYQTLGDTIAYGVWITDAEGYCTYASDSFLELLGMSLEQVQKFGWMDRLPPEDVQSTTDHWLHCVQTGEDFEHEHRFRAKDGSYRNVLAIGRPVRNDAGRITEWVGLNLDVTERKHMEEALKKAHDTLEEKVKERTAELEEAYNLLLENEVRLNEAQKIAHLGNWDWNLLTDKLYWSDEMYRIFRVDPLEFGETYGAFLDYVHPDDRDYVDNAVKEALNREFLSIEYRITLPDRGERIVYAQGEVTLDEKRTPIRMKGILHDITERKKAEEALEKIDKIRIKEIHHRIKNNLQVISSMLDLQSEMFEDEKVKEAFREGQNRVISMALIHEELYKGKGTDTDTLDFSVYLQKLAKSLFQTYNLSNRNIHLSMDLEENTFLDMDTAVPLGIIVNELISNSLKHAFTGRDEGEIQIKLHREGECKGEGSKSASFTLTVSDNGVGIPENLDIENLDSLGMQLVITLVDQLDGELELKRNNGTEFTMRFMVTENNNQASTPAPHN